MCAVTMLVVYIIHYNVQYTMYSRSRQKGVTIMRLLHACSGILYIENVDRYDAGTYLCKASSGYGRAITKVISVHVSGECRWSSLDVTRDFMGLHARLRLLIVSFRLTSISMAQ